MKRHSLKFLLGTVVLLVLGCRPSLAERQGDAARTGGVDTLLQTADTAFAALIERLSEPGGYFDTDNLISNETSYLHVLGALRDNGVTGGAYIGVGPDQNFSYIAEIRPSIAFIVDIRRDNMLQHLMFKAIFAASQNRLEYLAILFGKPVPAEVASWDERSLTDIVEYLDSAPSDRESAELAKNTVRSGVTRTGVSLSTDDLGTIERFHRSFVSAGLNLRFTSHNRGPQPYYPTYRQLLLERDLTGEYGSYLADEARFSFVKEMEQRNLVVPLVGDLAGPHAVREIGAYLREVGETVTAFYTSNVEFYLMGQGSFDEFGENITYLPRAEGGVIIRSYFGGRFRGRHPQSVPGYYSTQLLQLLDTLVEEHEAGGYMSYYDLVTKHALPLR